MNTPSVIVSTVPDPLLVHGRPVAYRCAGAAPRPLLLLHGWGGSSRYWQGTLAALAPLRTVVAPDLPGFGDSPPLPDEISIDSMVAWVIAFADTLGWERFDLNGHSYAAGLAAYVAARHPERVERVVLTSFSTYRNEPERRLVNAIHHIMALWMALRRPWMAHRPLVYRTVAGRFFYRIPADDAVLREAFIDFLKMDRRTALATAAGAGDAAITTALRSIRAPALVVGARQDNIMPPPGTPTAAELIPNAQLIWIERCGHLPMVERPEIYHRVVGEFLEKR